MSPLVICNTFYAKNKLHTLHWHGFSPVCVLRCVSCPMITVLWKECHAAVLAALIIRYRISPVWFLWWLMRFLFIIKVLIWFLSIVYPQMPFKSMISWVRFVTQVAVISPLWECIKFLFISKYLWHWLYLNSFPRVFWWPTQILLWGKFLWH